MYTIEYTITDRMIIEADDLEQAEYFTKEDLEDLGQPYEIVSIKELK